MKLAEVLDPSRIQLDQTLTSKKRVLEDIAKLLGSGESLSDTAIFNALLAREKLGSTGLGHGVAIPHGRIAETDSTIGAFIRLRHGIDYDAHDGQSVDLVFGLIVPQAATEAHLKLLAQVAEKFSEEDFCAKIRSAKTADEAMALLSA